MTSAAEPTFLPALSEVYSLVVLAGGGGSCCGKPPGGGGVRYSASVCPASCRMRASGGLCWEGRLGFVCFEGWPVVSLNGLGGNPAGFAGRAKRDELCRSGRNPGWWTYGGGTSSGTVRAFGSGNDPGRWTYVGNASSGTVRAFGSGGYRTGSCSYSACWGHYGHPSQ